MEVAFVSAGSLLFGPPQDPSKAVASRRLLPALLLGILRKLWGKHGAEQRLLHPLGRACMFVAGGSAVIVDVKHTPHALQEGYDFVPHVQLGDLWGNFPVLSYVVSICYAVFPIAGY